MPKYTVCVRETLARNVIVEADNEEEALGKVETMYRKEKIVLTYEDFTNVEIDIVE